MEPSGDGNRREHSPISQTNPLCGSFYFDPLSNPPTSQTHNQFYNPVGLTGIAHNAYTNAGYSYPLNFGFGVNQASNSEQFTEQELAELDDYLNRLSQGSNEHSSADQFNSIPASNASSGSPGPSDLFEQTADSGRALYEQAFNQWSVPYSVPTGSAVQSDPITSVYSPFGSSGFSYGENIGANNIEQPAQTVDPCDLHVSSSAVKPSFADVTKIKSSESNEKQSFQRQQSNVEKADSGTIAHVSTQSASAKARKPRPSKQGNRKTKVISTKPKEIKPDSRYGLDTFEETGIPKDQINSKGPCECNGRKNSISSVSSTMSGEDRDECVEGGRQTSTNRFNRQTEDTSAYMNDSKKDTKETPQKAFFDPRRIFSEQVTPKTADVQPEHFVPNNQQNIETENNKDNVKASVKSGSTKFINNDLRDTTQKQRHEQFTSKSNSTTEAKRRTTNHHDSARGSKSRKHDLKGDASGLRQGRRRPLAADRAQHLLGEWMLSGWQWFCWLLGELWKIIWNVGALVLSVFLLLLALLLHYTVSWSLKLWSFIKMKLPFLNRRQEQQGWPGGDGGGGLPPMGGRQKQYGLKEHIPLPATGDEAMRRLLMCKGKDPYSILGVRGDASDEDIKKYYRKQAFLVHPDKNKQPGAEEAFKILSHAFDLICTPEKRTDYDSHLDRQDAEAAMQEFSDLLTKLNDKMQEAANLLRCDQCGGKHRRVPTQRPVYSARFCERCQIMHPAKEGDVWAESRMMGFLWHYFACMEGKVFDITEWAKCKRDNFSQIQANAHQVIYRLTTTGNRAKYGSRSGEADLEEFLSNLFQQASCSKPPGDPSSAPAPPSGRPPPPSNAATTTKRGGRKKKKKH